MSTDGVAAAGKATAAEAAEAFATSSPETSRRRTLVWQDPVATAAAGATMSGMEYMEAIVTAKLPPPPIAVTMQLRPVELEAGRVVFEGVPGEEHYNPIDVVHGGYASTLLDSTLGCAVHTTLPAGVGYTSLGLEAKFVRPITRDTGRVLCEATVLYRGRKQATAEATLSAAESGKLLATGTAPTKRPRLMPAPSRKRLAGDGGCPIWGPPLFRESSLTLGAEWRFRWRGRMPLRMRLGTDVPSPEGSIQLRDGLRRRGSRPLKQTSSLKLPAEMRS